ncbi:MAG: hypothetical protein OSA23_09380 [Rhodospirillales bacterium]|nr:hypothetical protein [Rhodospirillales bacterium]
MSHRLIFIAILSIFALSLSNFGTSSKAANVMQCMSDCIKHEGNTATAKSTCKLRCVNVAVPDINAGKQAQLHERFQKVQSILQ